MEKNKRNILVAVISGIVVCLLCVGILFLNTSKEKNNMKGNSNAYEQGTEEINLGDTGYCTTGSAYNTNPSCTGLSCTGRGSQASCDNTYGCCSWVNTTPSCSNGLSNQSVCISTARGSCSYGYTGCDVVDGNGCYHYFCKSAPTAAPTAVPTAAPTAVKVTCWHANSSNTGCTSGQYTTCDNDPELYSSQSACVNSLSKVTCWHVNSSNTGCTSGQYITCNNDPELYSSQSACVNSLPKVTCWHANSSNTGCTSGQYKTCNNDPELYSSQSACVNSLPTTPTSAPTAVKVTCWHANSSNTGCTSGQYTTCDNDPELYSSQSACVNSLPKVTCWHANSSNTGCTSGQYITCNNDPELYSSQSACVNSLPTTPTSAPTADTRPCCDTCGGNTYCEAHCKTCSASPSPTATVSCQYKNQNACETGESTTCVKDSNNCWKPEIKVTCWHENSSKNGCTSGQYKTCDNDPELYNSEAECRSALGITTPVPGDKVTCWHEQNGNTCVSGQFITCANDPELYNTEAECKANLPNVATIYGCSLSYDSASNTLTLKGYTNASGVKVMSGAINGVITSSYKPTAAGVYSGKVWFSDNETRKCSYRVTTVPSQPTSSTGCGAGLGKDTTLTSGCSRCAPGYYSGENDDVCHKCPSGQFSDRGASKCISVSAPCCEHPYGHPHTIDDLSGCQQAVAAGVTVKPGSCPTTTNPKVTAVSASQSGTVYLNAQNYQYQIDDVDGQSGGAGFGYVTVAYVAYDQFGRVIDGSMLSWSINASYSSVVVSSSKNANGFTVTYKGLGCDQPTATVSVTATGNGGTGTGANGSATSSSLIIITKYTQWSRSDYNGEKNGYMLLTEGEYKEGCTAVSDPYTENGVTKYKYKYNRCCPGGGGGGSNPAPKYSFCCAKDDGSSYSWRVNQTSTTCPTGYHYDETHDESTCKDVITSACYVDSDGGYHWTSSPKPNWQLVPNITKEKNCKKEETPACYKDTHGNYVWGKYASSDGYTLITSISDESTCKAPEGKACYKNSNGDYKWTSNPPSGYTLVSGVGKPEDCVPPENPACYIHGDKFEWGKYENVSGYILVENITEKNKCKKPAEEACYKDPDGDYVWGEYSNDSGFTKIPNITDINQCGIEVPVDRTAINVSTIVYIFMAVLMAFGIGFIYYSTIMKKSNQ